MASATYIEKEYIPHEEKWCYWFDVEIGKDSGRYARCETPVGSYFIDCSGSSVDQRLIFKLERLCIVEELMRNTTGK